jgi:hypothetical protein
MIDIHFGILRENLSDEPFSLEERPGQQNGVITGKPRGI